MKKRASNKEFITWLKALFIKAGIKDVIKITVKDRPACNKNPNGYTEIRVFSEELNLLCTHHEQFVHNMFTDAGVPICGVYSKAMNIDSHDTSCSKTRIPGVLAHFM